MSAIARHAVIAVFSTAVLLAGIGADVALAQEGGDDIESRIKALEEQMKAQQRLIDQQSAELERLRQDAAARPAPSPEDEGASPPPAAAEGSRPIEGPAVGGEARLGAGAEASFEQRIDEYLKSLEKPDDIVAGYKDGFYLKTRDGRFKVGFGGRVMVDGLFAERTHPLNNTFLIRRARIAASGTLYDYYKFKVEVDINAGGRTVLTDGYIQGAFAPELSIKVGQFKKPVTVEFIQSSRWVPFVERSLAVDNLAPGRDIGVMVESYLFEKRLLLQAGLFNGTGQNATDVDDAKEVVGRISIDPFYGSGTLLEGLHFGFAATHSEDDFSLAGNRLLTAINTTLLTFNAGVGTDGNRDRYAAEFHWFVGSGSIRAEGIHVRMNDVELNGNGARSIDIWGGHVTMTYFLTGEKATLGRVDVLSPFDPREGTWGAFEVAVRGSWIEVEEEAVRLGLASGTDRAYDVTVGLNWYLNDVLAVRLDYNRVWFDDEINIGGGKLRNGEEAILGRIQIDF